MSKVLVIDDDAVVRSTLEAVLVDAGYEVTLAKDGVVGCTAFHREQPDVVVTDIMMPEQDGIGAIRQIISESPDTKIIAISGGARLSNVDFLQLARKLGARGVLPKPFDPDCLLTMISDCLLAA